MEDNLTPDPATEYEVPPAEPIEWQERKILTNEESVAKALAEIDIPLVRANYNGTYFRGYWNKFKNLFQPKLLQEKKTRLLQLAFLEKIQTLSAELPIMERAYILLGAFQYAKGRWLPFPNYGPLLTLDLKRDVLLEIISENDQRVKLANLFDNPNLVSNAADRAFAKFMQLHPELHRID